VLFFHGGGWVMGSIETHDALCHALTNLSGCLFISVDYRLAPEHRFPAAPVDAYAATCWAAESARSLRADPRRIALCGDSAGGNLAAVTALMARDHRGPEISCQVLVYPVTDCRLDTPSHRESSEGYLLTRELMLWFWNHYVEGEDAARHPHASPLRAGDLAGLPEALVLTAEYDPLRDEGEAYARRLKEAGVPVTLHRLEGLIHGFFRQYARIDRAREALEEVAAALRRSLS
jgi:acetyl esterase